MDLQQTDKNNSGNRQALFDLLDKDIKTNVGRIPVPDYLEIKAGTYGYDSYEEMYAEGCRIAGYEKISPEVMEQWRRQKEKERPSLKERLAKEQTKPLTAGNEQKKRQADKSLQEL